MEELGRYIDPFTDFERFVVQSKILFESEPNNGLLIDFLNELLGGRKTMTDLTYVKNEHLGRTDEDRKAIAEVSKLSK